MNPTRGIYLQLGGMHYRVFARCDAKRWHAVFCTLWHCETEVAVGGGATALHMTLARSSRPQHKYKTMLHAHCTATVTVMYVHTHALALYSSKMLLAANIVPSTRRQAAPELF